MLSNREVSLSLSLALLTVFTCAQCISITSEVIRKAEFGVYPQAESESMSKFNTAPFNGAVGAAPPRLTSASDSSALPRPSPESSGSSSSPAKKEQEPMGDEMAGKLIMKLQKNNGIYFMASLLEDGTYHKDTKAGGTFAALGREGWEDIPMAVRAAVVPLRRGLNSSPP